MKTFFSFILIIFLSAFFIPHTVYGANANAEKLVGIWNISAQITDDVTYKNWTGTITVTKRGKKISGLLDWSSVEGDWHVQEELSITVDGNTVTLQGTAVNMVSKPKSDSEYRLDNFTFSYDDITNETTPIKVIDDQGHRAVFTITKA